MALEGFSRDPILDIPTSSSNFNLPMPSQTKPASPKVGPQSPSQSLSQSPNTQSTAQRNTRSPSSPAAAAEPNPSTSSTQPTQEAQASQSIRNAPSPPTMLIHDTNPAIGPKEDDSAATKPRLFKVTPLILKGNSSNSNTPRSQNDEGKTAKSPRTPMTPQTPNKTPKSPKSPKTPKTENSSTGPQPIARVPSSEFLETQAAESLELVDSKFSPRHAQPGIRPHLLPKIPSFILTKAEHMSSAQEIHQKASELADLLKASKYTVAITGQAISYAGNIVVVAGCCCFGVFIGFQSQIDADSPN